MLSNFSDAKHPALQAYQEPQFEAAWKKIGRAMTQRSEPWLRDSHERVKHVRSDWPTIRVLGRRISLQSKIQRGRSGDGSTYPCFQRGFIFGSAYVYIGMAIAAAALAGVCYLAGRDIERSVWAEQQNSDLREANRALDAAHKAARIQEQEAARKVAAVSSTYQRDLANANRTKDIAMAALRSGALVLRDPVASSPPVSGGTAEAPACACGRDGPPGGVLSASASRVLSGEASRFLIALASEADVVATQLQACQALVRADRGG